MPKSEHEKLQAEAKKLNADLDAAKSEINAAKSEIAGLKAELTKATDDLNKQLAKKPILPVNLSFRTALLGGGQVLQLFNDASTAIPVRLSVKRPGTGSTKELEVVLRGNFINELGPQEGWGLESGDIIVVRNTKYEDLHTVCK